MIIIVLAVVGALALGLVLVGVIGTVLFLRSKDTNKGSYAPLPTVTVTPTTEPSTSPSSGATLIGPDSGGGNVRRNDQATEAAWVSPTGNISCAIDHDELWCWAEQHTWRIPDFGCQTDWGHSVVLWDGQVDYGCKGDPMCLSAVPGETDPCGLGEHREPLWWARGSDPIAYSYEEPNKALPYGTSIQVRDIRCTSRKTGMDCLSLSTGRGFLMSRDRLELR